MQVTDDKITDVAHKLWADVYEASFRGKDRGRFCITRKQLKKALLVERLHATTIERLQDEALSRGLIIIDLDDLFPCIEVDVVRRYRRPPTETFAKFFDDDDTPVSKEESDDDE